MVRVLFSRDLNEYYDGFRCVGHADYAERGYDIVCAAISTLTQTIILALEKLISLEIEVRTDQRTGLIHCRWTNHPEWVEKSQLLVETMILGLKEIQNLYPKHLSLNEAEVLK